MKKIAGIFLLTALAATGLWGQGRSRYEQNKLRFGIQASPSFQWMRSSEPKTISGNGSNTAFKFGASVENYFRPKLGLTVGVGLAANSGGTLRYEQAGTWLKGSYDSLLVKGANIHYRMNYVEVPIGLKARGGSNEDSDYSFYIEAGLVPAFRTKALADIRKTNSQNQEDIEIKETSKALNLSWAIGGGLEYSVRPSIALVGGLYYQGGLFDVTKNAGDDSKNTISGLTIKLGVVFDAD